MRSSLIGSVVALIVGGILLSNPIQLAHAQDAPLPRAFVRQTAGASFLLAEHAESGLPRVSVTEAFGAEVGWLLSPRWSLAVGYVSATHGVAEQGTGGGRLHSLQLLARRGLSHLPLSPYLQAGIHYTGTYRSQTRNGYGPVSGAGFIVPVSRNVAVFIEASSSIVLQDEAIDRAGGGFPVDVVTQLGASLVYRFEPVCRARPLGEVLLPRHLYVREEGRFGVEMPRRNDDVVFRWRFGDGDEATGRSVRHLYVAPGSYDVTLEVQQCGGTVVMRSTVDVTEGCADPPAIQALAVQPGRVAVGERVLFAAEVTGAGPFAYAWRVDGIVVSRDPALAHRFVDDTAYLVELTVRGCADQSARRSVLIRPVQPPSSVVVGPLDALVFVLNTCRFDTSSRPLPGPALLKGYVDTLRTDTNLRLVIEGFADYTPAPYNPELAWRRALKVRNALVRQGAVPQDLTARLIAVGNSEAASASECEVKDKGGGCLRQRKVSMWLTTRQALEGITWAPESVTRMLKECPVVPLD